MNNRNSGLKLVTVVVALVGSWLLVGPTVHAATLVVSNGSGPCVGAHYLSIQSAINASHPGDTINVCPGTYIEAIGVDQTHANLTIQGVGISNSDRAIIRPFVEFPIVGVVLVENGQNVTLKNLTIGR
jgi:pectin methylesterase-like acyl-CoA thioesterase